MSKCDLCGKDAKIHFGDGKGNTVERYCQTCGNRIMALNIGIEAAEDVPEELFIVDSDGKAHRFKIEYLILGYFQRLEAYEDCGTGYSCAVGAEFDITFPELWERMMKKLEKKLNTKYIDEEGWPINNKIVGDIVWDSETDEKVVVIDGKPYTWEEVYRWVKAHEGWQIKIEFADSTDDME